MMDELISDVRLIQVHHDERINDLDEVTENNGKAVIIHINKQINNGEYKENEFIPQLETTSDLSNHLTKICRFCLDIKNDMRSIYENGISEVIMSISSIQLNLEDGLPMQICTQCIAHLYRALAFKEQIEFSDVTLRHYITQGYFEGMKLIPLNYVDNDYKNEEVLKTIDEGVEILNENINSDESTKNSDILLNDNVNNDGGDDEFIITFPKNETVVQQQQMEPDKQCHQDQSQQIKIKETKQKIIKNRKKTKKNNRKQNLIETNEIQENLETNPDKLDINDSKIKTEIKPEIKEETVRLTRTKRRKNKKIVINEIQDNDDNEFIDNLSNPNDDKISTNDFNDDINEEEEEYQCSHCDRTFPDQRRLNRHIRIHKVRRRYLCPLCSKDFLDHSDLIKHSKKHTELAEKTKKFPYICSECYAGFNIEADLLIHFSIHSNNGKFVCQHCKKECLTSLQLKRHIRIHFLDKPHKCGICHKGFPEMGSLTRHYRKHTGEKREKKHLCNVCGKGYYDSHSLNVHTRTHTGERPWVCNICGKSFIDSRLLNSHMKVHSGEKPYNCHICKKRFTHQSTLTTHIRTHTGEKPYICSVCEKSFIQSSNLSLHMRVHSGEKPYECSVCSRSFASSSTLTMHTRIHTGEKPYICSICNKRFARHDLRAHMRTHTGEKPFSCTFCTRKFTTTGQLNQHVRTHSSVKPFVCEICQKRCSSSTYLKKHMRTHVNQQHIEDNISNLNEEIEEKVKIIRKIENESEQKNIDDNNLISTSDIDCNMSEIITENYNNLEDHHSRTVFLTRTDDNNELTNTNTLIRYQHHHHHNHEKNENVDDVDLEHLNVNVHHGDDVLVNTNELLSVINNSSNGLIQIPVLTSNELNANSSNLVTNLVYF